MTDPILTAEERLAAWLWAHTVSPKWWLRYALLMELSEADA